MSESNEGWRECADPVELAAAVAAGVEVYETTRTVRETPRDFDLAINHFEVGFIVPSSWSWSPEPPAPVTADELRERIARAIWEDDERAKRDESDDWDAKPLTDHEVYLANADAVLAVLPPSPVPPWPGEDDLRRIVETYACLGDWDHWTKTATGGYNALTVTARVVLAHLHGRHDDSTLPYENCLLCMLFRELPRANGVPVPPWPGAVLSGLCDEDGVPTWLAQAGQVRGEQVRQWRGDEWLIRGYLTPWNWVEVRAPRAVPEPETERVPWYEAIGREVFDQDGERVTIEHVQCGDGAGPSVTAYNAAERRDTSLLRVPITVRGDGTVEVLKDGGR